MLRGETPVDKARDSHHELAQGRRAVVSQSLEMWDKHAAKIEHFLPMHDFRADMQ
jgi:hypothetical protein